MAGHSQPGEFARRLDHLWRTVHPGSKPYTYEQVANGLAALGVDISLAYLSRLRNGERDNPTLQTIQGLAQFFGVPASYFLDDEEEERINRQLDLMVAMKDAGVRSLALRAHGLSEADLAAVSGVISSLRNARGLEDDVDVSDPTVTTEEQSDR